MGKNGSLSRFGGPHRRRRKPKASLWKLATWLGIPLLIAPFTYNCHNTTDQAPAAVETRQQDSDDQTVREMQNQTDDGAPSGSAKVRLSAQVTLSASKAAKAGMAAKLQAADDQIVPQGTSLLALYDNACRGRSNSPLKFEAEELKSNEAISVMALQAQAEDDPCLVRIDENHVRQLVDPLPDEVTSQFSANAEQVSAMATVNDPRLSEARHIVFSKALSAWDWFYSGAGIDKDVVVAVIDTGVLHTHPDLIDNIYTDGAGNHGKDFVNNDDDPLDDNGHGSHVSGIIGARANNNMGVTGVMGTRVKIMGVKVLNSAGSGTDTAIVNGIRYAADQNASVLNMSLGGKFQSTAIRDAMAYAAGKGVVLVIAAGNDGTLMDGTTNFYAPSGYSKDIPGCLSVGSVDAVSGAISSFSNYSTAYVWIGAPGSNGILSTYLANGYMALQGTSMASPVVAGAAALLVGEYKSRNIVYAPGDVVNLLTDSARPVPALNAAFRGGATLDIERAAKLFFSRYVMFGNAGTEAQ